LGDFLNVLASKIERNIEKQIKNGVVDVTSLKSRVIELNEELPEEGTDLSARSRKKGPLSPRNDRIIQSIARIKSEKAKSEKKRMKLQEFEIQKQSVDQLLKENQEEILSSFINELKRIKIKESFIKRYSAHKPKRRSEEEDYRDFGKIHKRCALVQEDKRQVHRPERTQLPR
jgi:hypothetical protein